MRKCGSFFAIEFLIPLPQRAAFFTVIPLFIFFFSLSDINKRCAVRFKRQKIFIGKL